MSLELQQHPAQNWQHSQEEMYDNIDETETLVFLDVESKKLYKPPPFIKEKHVKWVVCILYVFQYKEEKNKKNKSHNRYSYDIDQELIQSLL